MSERLFFDRSKCPHCGKVIFWYDNIPVISFILLKFKCRNCKKKISWQYPLVEIFTGFLFAAVGTTYFNPSDTTSWAPTIYLLGVAASMIAIFVYDMLYMEIPVIILWPSIFWALVFGFFFGMNKIGVSENMINLTFFSRFLAAAASFAFFFFLSKVSKEKWMGMGDAYLAIFLGLVLGWPQIISALFLAFFLGSVYGIILILAKMKTMKSQVPFAPFLVLGTLITMFFYKPIINWYVGLFYL